MKQFQQIVNCAEIKRKAIVKGDNKQWKLAVKTEGETTHNNVHIFDASKTWTGKLLLQATIKLIIICFLIQQFIYGKE